MTHRTQALLLFGGAAVLGMAQTAAAQHRHRPAVAHNEQGRLTPRDIESFEVGVSGAPRIQRILMNPFVHDGSILPSGGEPPGPPAPTTVIGLRPGMPGLLPRLVIRVEPTFSASGVLDGPATVPTPGSAVLLALAGVSVARRRRK
jgi:hypothetical protein